MAFEKDSGGSGVKKPQKLGGVVLNLAKENKKKADDEAAWAAQQDAKRRQEAAEDRARARDYGKITSSSPTAPTLNNTQVKGTIGIQDVIDYSEPAQKKGGNMTVPQGYKPTDSNSGSSMEQEFTQPEAQQPQTTYDAKTGAMTGPEGYVTRPSSTSSVTAPQSRDYTDEEISQMTRDRSNLVVPRTYSQAEKNKENNAGVPFDQATDMNDLYELWRQYYANQDEETPDNAWDNVVDDTSVLTPTNTPVTPQQAREAGPKYPATGTAAKVRDAAVPLWMQTDIKGLPILTEGLKDLSDPEFFYSLPEAIRNAIAPNIVLQEAPRAVNDALTKLDDKVDSLYDAYDNIGREKPEGNGPATRYLPDVTVTPEYQRAVEVLNRQGIYGDEADKQAKELVASMFNTKQDAIDWYTAEPEPDIALSMATETPKSTEGVEPKHYLGAGPHEPEEPTTSGGTASQKGSSGGGLLDAIVNLIANQDSSYNGDGTTTTFSTPKKEPDIAEPSSSTGNSGGILDSIANLIAGQDSSYNGDGTVTNFGYTPETPEQKRDRLAKETEAMQNGTAQREPDVAEPASSGGGVLNDIINFFTGNDYQYNEDGSVSKVNETPESKADRLARETAEAIANGSINNVPETSGQQTGIEDVIDNIMNGEYTPETNEEKRKRLENVNKYLAENGYTPEAYDTLEKRAIMEDLNNYLSENGYTPEAYDAYWASATNGGSSSGSSASGSDIPKGSKKYPPSYGQEGEVVKAPYKEGGYTEEELMKMGNKAYGTTYSGNAYEGYYQAPDGRYYPVDQEKAAYYQRYGTYNGWQEPMREYYNTFGTFYGYTPTWKQTGRNTGSGGGGRSYSYSSSRGGSSYGGNGYSGGNYSNVQPELTNQTKQRINNIMRNWTF